MHAHLKELSMGRYIKATGIDVTGDICEVLGPVIMGPFLATMGMRTCPPEPVSTKQKSSYIHVELNKNAFIYSVGRL